MQKKESNNLDQGFTEKIIKVAYGDAGIVDCLLHTNGDEAERLWTKAGGSAFRPYFHPDMFHSGDYVPVVEGRKVYALAVTFMPKVTFELLERHGSGGES